MLKYNATLSWEDKLEVAYLHALKKVEAGLGPQGPIGPQGPQGFQGNVGATGLQGPIGLTGLTGLTGQQGLQGPKGDTGATGAKGDTGDVGPQGPIGLKGDTGDVGATGATGAQGPAGAVANAVVYAEFGINSGVWTLGAVLPDSGDRPATWLICGGLAAVSDAFNWSVTIIATTDRNTGRVLVSGTPGSSAYVRVSGRNIEVIQHSGAWQVGYVSYMRVGGLV